MAVANPTTTKSSEALNHHSRMDESADNMHFPKGFLNATVGHTNWKDGSAEHVWEAMPLLPACLDYKDVTATAPGSPSDGDIYLLDDSGATYTVSAINWQSGNTVRYTFSGSPDLSSISTSNILVCTGATNTEHDGAFDVTAVSDPSDYIEVSNVLVTDATLDETTGASCELPHEDWNGGTNGSWVRYDSADSVYYKVDPISGQKCYDKTLGMERTFDGTRWLGPKHEFAIAFSDETSDLTTGTGKIEWQQMQKFRLSEVVVTVSTAPTGATLTVDLNDDGTSVFSTVVTVDASEKTSRTAATPAVISNPTIAVDSVMTVDIDQVGSTIAGAGAKIYMIGNFI